jgi:hypothetical protein
MLLPILVCSLCVSLEIDIHHSKCNPCFFPFLKVGSTLVTCIFFIDHLMSHFSSSHDLCVIETKMEALHPHISK